MRKLLRVKAFLHGPFAANECGACHNLPSTRSFRTSVKKAPPPGASTGETSGRLALPEEKLCLYCHEEKSPFYPANAGKVIHGPVASGECTTCHHPHRSRRRYMLKGDARGELCLHCHGEAGSDFRHLLPGAPTRLSGCVECHDPHMARKPFMLKKGGAGRTAYSDGGGRKVGKL